MTHLEFFPSTQVEAIRGRIGHPIVDADGHLIEFLPLVLDFAREIAGPEVARSLLEYLRQSQNPNDPRFSGARAFWGIPEENTLDRMTATLPRLMQARMDEIGIDFALMFPSAGLPFLAAPDAELRQAGARALNVYYARIFGPYRARMAPAAIIPSFTPREMLDELDHAVAGLGLKTIVTSAVVQRPTRPGGTGGTWIDTLAHESFHDYSPVWDRCAALGVVPTFHALGYGWGSRNSSKNYVYNHLGNFAAAQEAACRALLMGGVPRRLPGLRFSFLEGGVGWAAQLYADLHGHFEKRNREAVSMFDPRRFKLDVYEALMDRFADPPLARFRGEFEAAIRSLIDQPPADPASIDDFADSLIERPEDIVAVFRDQFHFGCEADDPMNALAFRGDMLPYGLRMNAMFASDIGHWDVPDIREVVPEAWELVEHGHIDETDFREFTFGNVVRMLTAMNPDFFAGTAVEGAARDYLGARAA
ncbi:MAG: amidohydrolase family protein [Gammaproteobacteria bacterium]